MSDESITVGELLLMTLLLGAPAYLLGALLQLALLRGRVARRYGLLAASVVLAFVLTLAAWVGLGLLPDRFLSWWPAPITPEPWRLGHLLFLPALLGSTVAFPLVGWLGLHRASRPERSSA